MKKFIYRDEAVSIYWVSAGLWLLRLYTTLKVDGEQHYKLQYTDIVVYNIWYSGMYNTTDVKGVTNMLQWGWQLYKYIELSNLLQWPDWQ